MKITIWIMIIVIVILVIALAVTNIPAKQKGKPYPRGGRVVKGAKGDVCSCVGSDHNLHTYKCGTTMPKICIYAIS